MDSVFLCRMIGIADGAIRRATLAAIRVSRGFRRTFFSEGTIFVTAALSTFKPLIAHFIQRDVVTFNVIDTLDGDSARGDYAGVMPGVVRPILEWETRVTSI